MTQTRRALIFTAAAAALLPAVPALAQSALSAADRARVDRAVAYLQGLTSVRGRFTETSARGRAQQGDYYLQRPGRARFEYDAPSRLLVVSDGSNVKRYDPRLNTFQQVPLGQTPLSLFLARQIRVDQGVRVEDVRDVPGGFAIVARDARRPRDGQIILTFAESPMRLREWTIVDAQGGRTRVQLNSLESAGSLNRDLFVLRDPTRRNSRN